VIGAGGLGQLATQYAKAMGLKVVAVDINDTTLEVCKAQGADATFNSRPSKEYVTKIRDLTKGGVHAAAVFSDAPAAYADAPAIIRIGGVLMVVGIARGPLQISTNDISMGKYRVKGANISIPQRMKKAVDFSAKYDIRPKVEIRALGELDDMVRDMRAGATAKRMVVNF
jgi:propanol-preferring alcohol dehydrogenase